MNKSHDELCQELERLHGDIRLMTQCVRDGHWPELCMMSSDPELDALGDAINSMHIRYENDLITAKAAVETANGQGQRLAHRLQETSDMLSEALTLGEESSARCRELKESRPVEIAEAVMRARREWAAQADPDYLRERDSRKAAEAIGKWAEKIWQIIQFADKKHTEDPSFPPVNFEMISELVTDMRDDAEKVAGGDGE